MSNKYPGGLVTLNPPAQDPALGAATNGVWTMDQALNAETNRSWAMYDPYYNQVVLNLHGNGTNGAQNNTFLDSSSNNFTITRNGNTTQGAFTPYSQYGSVYYGSGNYWQVPQSTNWDITGAAFTVECFVYLTGYTGDSNQGVALVGNFTGSNGGAGWQMGLTYGATPTLGLSYWNGGGGTSFGYTGTAVALNQWTHLAMTRSGSTIYLYVNGQCVYSGAAPSIGAGDKLTSGAYVQNLSYPSYVYGYISNLRIVKGTALYSGTGSFTVPTSRLTAVTNTVFLGNQSNRFVDNSGTAGAFTFGGTPSIQNFQPFQQNLPYESSRLGGSGYFDGSGDYLSFPSSSASLLPSAGLFTYEFWVYTPSSALSTCFSYGGSTGNLRCFVSSGGLQLWNGSSQITAGNTALINYGAWNHVVVQRDATNLATYVNGVRDYNSANSSNFNAGTLYLGAEAGSNPLTGYISDFKLTLGSALYSGATISVPTTPSSSTGSTAYVGFTNGAIFDNAAMNDLETVGNAQISTSVKKYGSGSMYFDGTGDYLVVPNSPNLNLSSGDFTIEAWVYQAVSTQGAVINKDGAYGSSYPSWNIGFNSSGKFIFEVGSGNGVGYVQTLTASSFSNTTNTWYHVAAVKSGTTLTLYVNGVSQASATQSGTIVDGGKPVLAGYQTGQPDYFNGYIDDIRITKGVARYTGTFTPPTSQLQDQ